MNTGKYVFAQLVEFLPKRIFDGIAKKSGGNKYVKHFTCWNQLLAMMFGQLTNRESLRDLIVAIDAHSSKQLINNITNTKLASIFTLAIFYNFIIYLRSFYKNHFNK